MFNVSTRADYGLILMIELAKKYGQGYVSLTEITKDKKLSSGYLVQIIQPLVAAKLIKSKEGRGGGYALIKKPETISVLNIIEILDGPVILVSCLKKGAKKCACASGCEIKGMWPVVVRDIKKVLDKKSLADLLKEAR